MKRVLLLAAVFLAVGASGAQAAPILTAHKARAKIKRGEPTASFHGCERLGPNHLRCRVTLYGAVVRVTPEGEEEVVQVLRFPERVDVWARGVEWWSAESLLPSS